MTSTNSTPFVALMSAPAVNYWLSGSADINAVKAPIVMHQGEPYYYADDLQKILIDGEFEELCLDVITILTDKFQ